MKQFKLLILLLVIGFVGEAQINYLPIKSRYKLIAGLFDSTLHIPSGTTPGLRTGGYDYRGALFYKTSDSTVYVYTGTQWISVKGSGGSGSADSTIFATLYRLDTAKINLRTLIAAKLAIADTANNWVTSLYRKAGTDSVFYTKGSSHTFAFKDSIGAGGGGGTPAGNYGNVQLNRNGALATPASDSLDFDAGLNIKGALTATALPTGGVAADSLVVVTSAGALKKRNAAAFPSGSGVDLRVALWNGTNSLTSHQRYTWSNSNDYPSLIIGAGTGATYGASVQLRSVVGDYGAISTDGNQFAIYGLPGTKSVNIYSHSGGSLLLGISKGNTGGAAIFKKTIIIVDTAVGGPSLGSIHGEYNAGDSNSIGTDVGRHMFRGIGRTYANNGSFNTFYSTVEAGNTTYSQNHIINWQSDAKKTGANTLGIIYHMGILGDSINGGLVQHRWGLYMYDAYVKPGATLAEQTALRVPKFKAGIRNYDMFSDSAQTVKMDGNILVGDSVLAPSARKTLHMFNGTAPTGNISGSVLYSESGEFKVRNSSGAINTLSGNAVFSGTLTTGDPGSGAGAWKLGTGITTSGLVLNTTTYVEITIGGTTYRLAVVDPPQP